MVSHPKIRVTGLLFFIAGIYQMIQSGESVIFLIIFGVMTCAGLIAFCAPHKVIDNQRSGEG